MHLALRLVSKFMDLPWRDIDTFAKLQKSLNITLHEMETLIDKYLSCDLFTKEDLLSELEIEDAEFVDNLLTSNTKTATEFKLRQRALHVIQGTSVSIDC